MLTCRRSIPMREDEVAACFDRIINNLNFLGFTTVKRTSVTLDMAGPPLRFGLGRDSPVPSSLLRNLHFSWSSDRLQAAARMSGAIVIFQLAVLALFLFFVVSNLAHSGNPDATAQGILAVFNLSIICLVLPMPWVMWYFCVRRTLYRLLLT